MEIISRAEAKTLGLKRFFTGVPCKHGHIDERQVSNGTCCECDRIGTNKRYREVTKADPEKLAKYRKRGHKSRTKWRNENPEKVREQAHKWKQANPEKVRENSRKAMAKWALANPEKVREKSRKQYQNKPEYYIEKKAQRDRDLERRTYWGLKDIITLRKLCRKISKETGIPHEVDHIVPVYAVDPVTREDVASGLNVPENLRIITKAANRSKSNKFDPDSYVH